MYNKLKTFLIILLFGTGVLLHNAVFAREDILLINNSIIQQTQTSKNIIDQALDDKNSAINIIQDEMPKPKKKKHKHINVNLVFKFIFAMLWVAVSSAAIFLILLSYKRLIAGKNIAKLAYMDTANVLDTPKTFKEAIKLFLDKTKWD